MRIRVFKDANGDVLGVCSQEGDEDADGQMALEEGGYLEEHDVNRSDLADASRLFEDLKKKRGRRVASA